MTVMVMRRSDVERFMWPSTTHYATRGWRRQDRLLGNLCQALQEHWTLNSGRRLDGVPEDLLPALKRQVRVALAELMAEVRQQREPPV